MDEMLYVNLLKAIAISASVLGLLIGLDLLIGAPAVTFLKKVLEKSYDFDNAIKRVLEKTYDFEKIIINPKIKKGIGIAFLCLSLIIFLLAMKV
ncbi:MAG: hypothetical protein ABH914_03365 [Candidatus Omnitrophota bacterium]